MKQLTHVDFDPIKTLRLLRGDEMVNSRKLLEQACHMIIRQQDQIQAIRRAAAELHARTEKIK